MQRRESYRILLPVANALMVNLFLEEDYGLGEWPLHDLSVAGLGATVIGHPDLEPSQTIHRLRFTLPKHHVIECSGAVRHVTPVGDNRKSMRHCVGVAFSGLPRAMEVAIQRFVVKIEHERRQLLAK
jgi:c-di-GMP-binding flagellar brake protein YcgR